MEDENGNLYSGLKEQYQVINDWAIDFNDNKRSRDTMHLMLSTPPGSNRDSALKLLENF